MTYAVQLVTAFLGSLGFSVLFNVRRTKLLIAGFGGLLSWGVYLLLAQWLTEGPMLCFYASVCVSIYAEVFARVKKTPTTSFLVPGMIPLIPGGALYNTMQYAIAGNWEEFFPTAAYTLRVALALAAGIILISSVMRVAAADAAAVRRRHTEPLQK